MIYINNLEFRIKDCELQIDDCGLLKIGGYVNVTERESEMLYNKRSGKWFHEIIKRGAFAKAIKKAKNIPLLFEHDWNRPLADTANGSLELREDNIGLRFDAVIDDENVYELVKTGQINSCSFGFRALKDIIQPINSKLEKRFVETMELLEVSIVKNPAYVGSLCESRSYEEEIKKEKEKLLTTEEKDELEDKIENTIEETSEEEKTEEMLEEKIEDDKEEDRKKKCGSPCGSSKREFDDCDDSDDVEDIVEDILENDKPEKEEIANIEVLKQYLEEFINEKLESLEKTKIEASSKFDELEEVKRINKEKEEELKNIALKRNADILRLQLELLKLKELKRGI